MSRVNPGLLVALVSIMAAAAVAFEINEAKTINGAFYVKLDGNKGSLTCTSNVKMKLCELKSVINN